MANRSVGSCPGVASGADLRGTFNGGVPASAARLREALERVESGESDGIVAVRLTQFGASLREALRSIERIEAAGGTFVSVGDGIDLSTPTGRLILRLLLSVAEW